jgi:diguanylate cyclase (GGDEF)-like protein/PAS domain S-box-containing protein
VAWPRIPFLVPFVSCFICVTFATVFVEVFQRSGTSTNVIWVANGLLLTYLLLSPRWRWPGYLITGMAAMTAGSAFIGEHWDTNLLYNAMNFVEVLIGALLLRGKFTELPRFTDRKYLLRFVAYAIFAGPAIAGAILTLVLWLWKHDPPLQTFMEWFIGDGLGAAITVPTFAAIFATRFSKSTSLRQHWTYPVVLAAVTLVAFYQNKVPIFLLIFPLLVLLLMRLGLGWAALATLFIAATGSSLSIHGFGPFAIARSDHSIAASIQMQFFVACCIFMIYVVSVILQDRKTAEDRLQEIAATHALVTDNSRDVILIADLDGRRRYVSPGVEAMKGWKPEELIGLKLSEQAHPDDREKLEDAIQQLRNGSDGVILEYRTQKRNGQYVWVESSLRIFRDRKTRIPAGILSLVRDISERKRSEGLLLQAYRSLEELAVMDALTGVANRRRFDECLADEWNRTMRLQMPISLLLIDADSFKQHNDTYGHLRGDRYLKEIANAALDVAKRPEDLVARIGGDEFAVILPCTENHGAVEIGIQIRAALKDRIHASEGESTDFVTISIGCVTVIPKVGEQAMILVQFADEALYTAKRSGRDQLCNRAHAFAEPVPTRITGSLAISRI